MQEHTIFRPTDAVQAANTTSSPLGEAASVIDVHSTVDGQGVMNGHSATEMAGSADVVQTAMFERTARRVAARPRNEGDPRWRSNAACRDTDPELFFPVGTTGHALVQIEDARAVCMSCACQESCLEYALSTNQDSGVWGGASELERRQLRRTYLKRRPGRTTIDLDRDVDLTI